MCAINDYDTTPSTSIEQTQVDGSAVQSVHQSNGNDEEDGKSLLAGLRISGFPLHRHFPYAERSADDLHAHRPASERSRHCHLA